MNNNKVADLREDYKAKSLDIDDVLENPIEQFHEWFEEAIAVKQREANAMTLATCSNDGFPSARIVLLKGYDERGFVFYTNYNSRKGEELMAHPYAALVFCWLELERQIRIEGSVEKIDPIDSDTYFHSRPKGSQIGACASPQSKKIKSRLTLEKKVAALQKKYEAADVLPRPKHWGGYRVIPNKIEFWQGRTSRLHDRIQYTKKKRGGWKIERLAP